MSLNVANHRSYYLLLCLFFFLLSIPSFGQDKLLTQFEQISSNITGNVGVCAWVIETGDSISWNGDKKFPMQSVYKFPIAMAMLNQIDEGKCSLDELIKIDTSVYIPENGHSPLRDKYPNGADMTISDLLKYNIAESDGTACDVLLRLLGGTKNAERYVHKLGITDMAIATTEMIQVANDTIQYQNWATPKAMCQLLKVFYEARTLSEKSRGLLLAYMSVSAPWFDGRIKGLLPKGTFVAHKTGTAGTINGLTRATNDAGMITLPNGLHLAISVFIMDSYASQKERDLTIAKISRAAFDHYAKAK